MGKIGYSLIMVFAIEMALILFAKQSIPGTALYTLVTNPSDWDSTLLLGQVLTDVLLVGGVAGIVAGLYFVRNEWIVYASISVVFLSFGSVLYQLWQFLGKEALLGDAGPIIATLLIGGWVIMYIVTVLDFSRAKD